MIGFCELFQPLLYVIPRVEREWIPHRRVKTFHLHAALLRHAFAHAENSPLLPPVGVWSVS
jgi:hypothetical protein